MPIGSGAVAN